VIDRTGIKINQLPHTQKMNELINWPKYQTDLSRLSGRFSAYLYIGVTEKRLCLFESACRSWDDGDELENRAEFFGKSLRMVWEMAGVQAVHNVMPASSSTPTARSMHASCINHACWHNQRTTINPKYFSRWVRYNMHAFSQGWEGIISATTYTWKTWDITHTQK
jgi:hypothetical protein